MLRVGKKGGKEKTLLKFEKVGKLGDLSFIDNEPNTIFIVDISEVLEALPVYKNNLIKKLNIYKNKYNFNFKEYKNWIIIGNLKFKFPELKIIR